MSLGFSTGHADAFEDLLGELVPQLKDQKNLLIEFAYLLGEMTIYAENEVGNDDSDVAKAIEIFERITGESWKPWSRAR